MEWTMEFTLNDNGVMGNGNVIVHSFIAYSCI